MAFSPEEMRRSKVQRLYDACNAVFRRKQEFPTLREIRWLQGLLDTMEAVDVGIDGSESSDDDDEGGLMGVSDLQSRNGLISGPRIREITYVHIHECEEFSMGVFCFPAGATLPLHDHPEMVVLSKLLYGSVSARSYDWVISPVSTHPKYGLARLVMDDQVLEAPCEASVLFPRSGGNLHTFTAVTPCAILDVLTPPYAEELGRPSTYFFEMPIPCLPGFAILEEREVRVPDDLEVKGAPYLGPEIAIDVEFCSPS